MNRSSDSIAFTFREFNELVAKRNLLVMQWLSPASRANLIIRNVILGFSRQVGIHPRLYAVTRSARLLVLTKSTAV
jgi:hypothetical protein